MSKSKVKGKRKELTKVRSKKKLHAAQVRETLLRAVSEGRIPALARADADADADADVSSDQRQTRVQFVYPRGAARKDKPIVFSFYKRSKLQNSANGTANAKLSSEDDEGADAETQPKKFAKKESIETIESILGGKKSPTGKLSSSSPKAASASQAESLVGDSAGKPPLSRKLSGVSVQDAVKDKFGCRPRANSTDGELNLPRRGLCDEGSVLGSYQWSPTWKQKAPKGLVNLGNTCFLNATLQCLAYIPPLCQCLTALEMQSGKLGQGQRITEILKRLFRQIHDLDVAKSNGVSPGGSISPRQIVKAVPILGNIGNRNGYKFRPGRQEDAHEFLVHLLDAMQDGELKAAGINQHSRGWRDKLPIPRLDETTFIHRVFGGYLRSQVRCTKCGYCSNTYDPFLDLALEVSKKSSTSISSAFQEFAKKETLDRDNRWRCSGCRKDVCATKQLTVFRPPLSLCIQLKRFTFSSGMGFGNFGSFSKGMRFMGMGGGGGGSKIGKTVEFPAVLKLPLSDGRKCEYSLTGVVVHLGGSATSGHYTAFVKKPGVKGSSKWYHMDDSFVEPVSENAVLKQKDAYVLFYSRTEVKLELPSPPSRASMTTEEAKALNVARSRARSGSFSRETQSTVAKSPKVNDVVEAVDKKATDVPRSAINGVGPRTLGKNPAATEKKSKAEPKSEGRVLQEDNVSLASNSKEDDARHARPDEGKVHDAVKPKQLDQPSIGSSVQKKKTRVVLDRGSAHGKLEVMIGPRYKAKKAWKPKVAITQSSEENLGLLGTKRVSRWDEEDVTEVKDSGRSDAVRKMEKKEKARKRSMHLDRWDSSLDQGTTKKVKIAVEAPVIYNDAKSNPFHRIQSGMQKMNRGRAKGSHDQGKKGSNDHAKKGSHGKGKKGSRDQGKKGNNRRHNGKDQSPFKSR